MDAKWKPRRKPYTPSWVNQGGSGKSNVYGEQQSEYAQYEKSLSDASSTTNEASHIGKGFGGGEATRDPEPTAYDPNDPKGKQSEIHKAESFAEYLAKREAT